MPLIRPCLLCVRETDASVARYALLPSTLLWKLPRCLFWECLVRSWHFSSFILNIICMLFEIIHSFVPWYLTYCLLPFDHWLFVQTSSTMIVISAILFFSISGNLLVFANKSSHSVSWDWWTTLSSLSGMVCFSLIVQVQLLLVRAFIFMAHMAPFRLDLDLRGCVVYFRCFEF